MANRTPPREGRRIIAIQMLPKAYDEILRLKGEETWTRFIIQCVLTKVGDNSLLQDELGSLTKEPKEQKPKDKKKTKKGKTEVPSAEEAEGAAKGEVTEEVKHEPTVKELTSAGVSTPAMRQPKKGKTLQELQADKK